MAIDWAKYNQTEQIKRALKSGPAAAGIAAGLLAPLLISNDDRNYASSAAITTPLVAAAYTAMPAFRRFIKEETNPTKSFFAEAARNIKGVPARDYAGIQDLKREFNAGKIRTPAFNKAVGAFLGVQPKKNNLDSQITALRKTFGKVLEGENGFGAERYLENVVHAESLRYLPTAELAMYGNSRVAPRIGMNGVQSMIERQITNRNEPFIKAMNFHLQKMKTMSYNGSEVVADLMGDSAEHLGSHRVLDWKSGSARIKQQRPDLFDALNDQIKTGVIKSNDVRIISGNSAINPIIGLQLNGNNIPVVGKDGSIFGGKTWETPGVSRGIFTQNAKFKSDVFAVKHLGMGMDNRIMDDLSRANIFGGFDRLSDWIDPDTNRPGIISTNSNLPNRMISQQNIGSNALGFGKDGMTGYNNQEAREMHEFVGGRLNKLGLTQITESGEGVFANKEVEKIAFGGMLDPTQQDTFYRSLSKNFTFGEIPKNAKSSPWALPSGLIDLAEGESLPVIGLTEGAVSDAQQHFFSSLPNSTKDLHAFETEAIAMLMKRHSLDETAAHRSWQDLSKFLSKPKNLEIMRRSEVLGEGTKIGGAGLGSFTTSRNRTFKLDGHSLGDNPESLIGTRLKRGQILGFNAGNPIQGEGQQNFLESFMKLDDGTFSVGISEREIIGTGSKLNLLGGKRGLIGHMFSKSETKVFAKGLSLYNKLTGSGGAISGNNHVFGLYESEAGKGSVLEQIPQLLSFTRHHLDDMRQTDLLGKLDSGLIERGMSFKDGTLIEDSNRFIGMSAAQKATDHLKTKNLAESIMEEAGARIRRLANANPVELNQLGRDYAATNMGFREFVQHYSAPMGGMVMSGTSYNVPTQTKVSMEVLQDLAISGNYGIIKDLQDRVKYIDGDPGMTRKVAEYLTGNKDAIPNRIGMREALGGQASTIRLSTAEGRLGSIFDENHTLAKDNYIMQFPDGREQPVLGHEAYGGKVNRYDGMLSSAEGSPERSLYNLAKGYEKGETGKDLDALHEAYQESINPYLYGKNSFLGAGGIDELGAGGAVQYRASTLKFADGSINPFEIKVSKYYASRLKDKALSEELLRGGRISGAAWRYPVADVPGVMLKVDKTLKPHEFGIDHRMTQLLDADGDGDSLYVSAMTKGSNGEKDVLAAVGQGSSQHNRLLEHEQYQAKMFNELPSQMGTVAKPWEERYETAISNVRNRSKVLQSRLVKRTIGEFSNTRTTLLDMVENSSTVFDQGERDTLKSIFFDPYQTPITASKKPQAGLTYEKARNLNARLNNSMNGGTFEEFHNALKGTSAFAPEGVAEQMASHEDLLRKVHAGFNPEIYRASKAKTASLYKGAKVDLNASLTASNMIPYSGGARRVSQETSTGARMAAEAIGAQNEFTASASKVGRILEESGAKKALGVGLGIAAVAGLLTTTIRSPRAKSGNNYRPEVVASGHNVPGEAEPGSMSPNSPPKTRVSNQQPNVNQAMVVPIHQNTDIEVNMKTDDPQRAAEASKLVSRMGGSGNTTVTNNYRNNNLTSLRNKQKLRDRLDEI